MHMYWNVMFRIYIWHRQDSSIYDMHDNRRARSLFHTEQSTMVDTGNTVMHHVTSQCIMLSIIKHRTTKASQMDESAATIE